MSLLTGHAASWAIAVMHDSRAGLPSLSLLQSSVVYSTTLFSEGRREVNGLYSR